MSVQGAADDGLTATKPVRATTASDLIKLRRWHNVVPDMSEKLS